MAGSNNPQPPADSGRGLGVPPEAAQIEAESLADLAAKQAPIDWPAIDNIYSDPMGPIGLPPWPKDMDVPEIDDERWMR